MTYLEELQDPPTTTPKLIAAPDITEPTKQLRYFTHSSCKRAGSETTEDQGDTKRVQAIIAQIILGIDKDELDLDKLKNPLGNDLETTFPAKVITSIHIPCTYKKAINDLKHIEQWHTVIAKEMISLYTNRTFQEVILLKESNLVSYK
jgi:hypothetical protein